MKETRKSALRRSKEIIFQEYLSGVGIDIGAGDDGLSLYQTLFPSILDVKNWDREDGDAHLMSGIPSNYYDFVHSSHCLEHLENPYLGLANWIRICKPGGYLIITVPDEDLYEKGMWPSLFNSDHKSSFTIFKSKKLLPRSINLLDMVQEFAQIAECERISLIREGYDPRLGVVDQTATGNAECAIEVILKKKEVPSVEEFLASAQGFEKSHNRKLANTVYLEALAIHKHEFILYHSYAMLLNDLGYYDDTLSLWESCVQRLPHLHEPRLYRALQLISMGRLMEGFSQRDLLVSDDRRTSCRPPKEYPRWRGENLKNKSIVIWTEFGYGDEIFFFRFAKILEESGAKAVSVVCQDPLLNLFVNGSKYKIYSVRNVDSVPVHDYWVFPHSIMAHLPLAICDVSGEAYLKLKTIFPSHRLSNDLFARKRIGLCYAGSPNHENDFSRSLPSASYLEDLLNMKQFTYFSFQKGAREAEARDLFAKYENFIDLSPRINDYLDTANFILQMDLVITVDTSVAHLAGALGVPVWIMLPTVTDWRWQLGVDFSNWYSSAELFRQKWQGEWTEVLRRIQNRLEVLDPS